MMTSVSLLFTLLLAGCSQLAQAEDYVTEVFFVADQEVVNSYMNVGYDKATAISTLKGDIDFFVYQMNKYYKTMSDNGLNMEVRMIGLEIMAEKEMFEECVRLRKTDLDASFSLVLFREWLRTNQIHKQYAYDVAIVWTGWDIWGNSGKTTAGFAMTGAVCRPDYALGIVEYDGSQATAIKTAHEIAHSLGASHDRGKCSSRDGYLMSSMSNSGNKHRWEFSSCTVDAIVTNINDLNTKDMNCLTKANTTTTDPGFKMSSQLGRDIMNPDQVCQRRLQMKDSFFCTKPYSWQRLLPQGDVVCKTIYCDKGSDTGCRGMMPTEGMVCDVGKRCNEGSCVTAPSDFPTPTNLVKDCIFGDSPAIYSDDKKMTCPEFIEAKGVSACYQYEGQCCATCASKKMNIAGCEYGDKSAACSTYQPYQICGSSAKTCCYTCKDYKGKRSNDIFSMLQPKIIIEEENFDKEVDPLTIIDEETEENVETERFIAED